MPRPLTILLVDDDDDCRALSREAITRGCPNGNIFEADGAADALDFLYARGTHTDSPRPDILYLDLEMPGMSGLEVCKAVRDNPETSSIPIIILSAGAQRDEISEGYAVGANDYVFKPFDPDDLLERIEKLI